MKTRLANGLVLTVLFTMNSAWACQFALSPPGNDDRQVSMGGYVYGDNDWMRKKKTRTVAAAAPQSASSINVATLPSVRLTLPFRTYRDYLIVVQGSLGGKLGRNLIIDTGTDPSVIDSRAAQELRMAGVVGKLAVHDQVVDAQQAVLPSVQIGTLRAESLPVLIRDLGFLQKDLGIRIDAVIGLDVLSLSNFSINYTTRRIVFGVTPVSGSSVPFQSAPPWLTVRMEVDGVSVDLLLDTAASGILLFQSRIRNRLQLISLGERTSSNLGGEVRLHCVMLARTKFGETHFGQENAFVVEDQEDESREFDGLLGPTALGLKQIAFDFQRHTFSWAR